MTLPDFASAQAYAFQLLEHALPSHLCYHSLAHTRDEVLPAVEQFARLEGVSEEELLLLRTAAWYHDVGFVEHSLEHEMSSVRIAADVLPHFGYTPGQIEMICDMIMATKLPQSPSTRLQALLADADLEALGRTGYWSHMQVVRAELAATGVLLSDEEWYARELDFLQSHRYWTDAARALRDEEKQRNIDMLRLLLAGCQGITAQ